MKKIICVLTIVSILMGISSCGRKGNDISKAAKVPEDGIWWNDKITAVTSDEIRKELNETPYQISGWPYAADEESFVLLFYIVGSKTRANTILRRYTYEGELLGQVDIGGFFGFEDDYYSPDVIYKSDGKYYTFISLYDDEIESYVSRGYEIDFDNGVLKDPFTLELPSDGGGHPELNALTGTGDKLVCLLDIWDKNFNVSYELCVYDKDDVRTFFPDFGNNVKINYITDLMSSGNSATFIASVNANGIDKIYYCSLETDTFEFIFTEADPELETAQFVSGCGVFDTNDGRTVKKIDPATGTGSVIADLADTYINGQYNGFYQVIWATDDKVALLARDDDLSQNLPDICIILLERAESDPNAGKALLKIASLDQMTEQEYFAVNDFNRHSDEFFIEVENKYCDAAMNKDRDIDSDSDSYHAAVMAYAADAVTLLMSDIREGTGPDLVIYSNESAQLNDTDYLIDLSQRISSEDSIKSGGYMDFIMQPNGRDGKHYRLDYGFEFDGFVARNNLIGDGTKGLTFEQYDRIINESNRGVNMLHENRQLMMKELIECSDYLAFDKEGNLLLDSDGFRAMADYIASIPEGTVFDNLIDDNVDPVQQAACNFRSFAGFYDQVYSGYSIIGLPSSDGHAETIKGRGIGITSCSVLQDAAWSFAVKMLSPEVQYKSIFYDPVLISTQKQLFTDYVNAVNATVDSSDLESEIPEGIVDYYISQISDAVVVPDVDSSMLVIFNEEMPAYFEGQKSFDEVKVIIESRVNLMLSERG